MTENTTPKAITQCQINLYDVIIRNSDGSLGKQTSDLKITFVKFTYPGHKPYSPSLPHFFSLRGVLRTN